MKMKAQWIQQRDEAIENAREVCYYLQQVFVGQSPTADVELTVSLVVYTRFVFQYWDGSYPIPPERVRDVQRIAGELLSRRLTGRIAWDDPHVELAMDRLSALERGRTGPVHRNRLFSPGELARLASEIAPVLPMDFVTAVGLRCDCPSRVVYVVIHDGTPSAAQLQSECVDVYDHGCGTLQQPSPTSIGGCKDAPGGVMGVAHDMIGRLMIDGIPVRGPYWYRDGAMYGWDPDLYPDLASKSEATS